MVCHGEIGPVFLGGFSLSGRLPTNSRRRAGIQRFSDVRSRCFLGESAVSGYEDVLGMGRRTLTGTDNGTFAPDEVEVFRVTTG